MSKYLSFALLTIFGVVYLIEATSDSVKIKFLAEEISPDVFEEVPELDLLKISYPSGVKVDLGNVLTPTQVKDQPTVEWEAETGAFYTLLLTDPDAPSRKNPIKREFRHWLTVNIAGNDLSSGETKVQFIGSGAPQGTGLHRYVFLLFKQPEGKIDFDIPYVSDRSALERYATSTRSLMSKYDLKVVAGNFYQAEYDDYVKILHAQLTGRVNWQ